MKACVVRRHGLMLTDCVKGGQTTLLTISNNYDFISKNHAIYNYLIYYAIEFIFGYY